MLLATTEPVHPVATGGIQASAHDLLAGLAQLPAFEAQLLSAAAGAHLVRIAERLESLGIPCRCFEGGLRYGLCGYSATLVDRDRFGVTLDAMLRCAHADVIVAQAAGWRSVVRKARAAQTPVVHWLHGWLGLLDDAELPAADLLLANSTFTANNVADRFRLRSIVFHPPIEPSRVTASRHAGATGTITLINPHPDKGVNIFLELARRMRDRHFVAVDCWGTPPFVELALRREPNVEYLPVRSAMAEIYARTALLLVPTLVDETFGRVVVEAHLNGVPVLASDRGALPDVVGGGGQLASPAAPIASWVEAVESLTAPGAYGHWSRAARRNCARFDFTRTLDSFAELVRSLLDPERKTQ